MLDKLFIQIINMSYLGGIVILFIVVARLLLKKAPKKYSYIVWMPALFRLTIPGSFTSTLSLIPGSPKLIREGLLYKLRPQIASGIRSFHQGVNASLPLGDITASGNPLQICTSVASFIWMIGVLVFLLYGIFSFVRKKNKLKKAQYKKENIYIVEGVDTPFVMGLIKPKIYLPDFLLDSEKDYILLHEKSHINRFDHIIRFISFLALSIHWFNPLAWIAFSLSGKDMEMSCDESVINKLGQDVKKDYSQSLVNLASGKKGHRLLSLAFGEGKTKGRVKNIITFRQAKPYTIILALVILLAVFVGLMTNPKEDSADIAEKFLIIHTSPEKQGFSEYYQKFTAGSESASDRDRYIYLMEKEYGFLMTDEAFEKALSNRFIPWHELIIQDDDLQIEIDLLELSDKNIYRDQREHYEFFISLGVEFSNNTKKLLSIPGDIVLRKTEDGWKVDAFKIDYRNLSEVLSF